MFIPRLPWHSQSLQIDEYILLRAFMKVCPLPGMPCHGHAVRITRDPRLRTGLHPPGEPVDAPERLRPN
jgi:hypothetical protein